MLNTRNLHSTAPITSVKYLRAFLTNIQQISRFFGTSLPLVLFLRLFSWYKIYFTYIQGQFSRQLREKISQHFEVAVHVLK